MNTHSTLLYLLFIASLLGIVAASIIVQGNFMINGNVSWLLMGAERILDGQKMSDIFFEGNPPLCIIIYMPFIIISKLLNIPLADATYFGALAFSIMSIALVWHILQKNKDLSLTQHMTVVFAYAIALTLFQSISFADKEHLIIIGFAPFVLYQYAYNQGKKFNLFFSVFVVSLGAIVTLVKPHYGLIPTLLILHRLYKTKSIKKTILAPDFFALSIATLIYISLLVTVFSDYLSIILPLALPHYVHSSIPFSSMQVGTIYAFVVFFAFLGEETINKTDSKELGFLRFLYFISLLCFIPFFVQAKGFSTHLIPAMTFFMMALGLSLTSHLNKKCNNACSFFLAFLGCLLAFKVLNPIPLKYATKQEVEKLPLTKYINENCTKTCTFAFLSDTLEISTSTAIHTNTTYASRFSFPWLLPPVIKQINTLQTDDAEYLSVKETEREILKMMTNDIQVHHPDLIFIDQMPRISADKNFDFNAYLNNFPAFTNEISENYIPSAELSLKIEDYLPNLKGRGFPEKNFLVYKRKKTN